jgi:WD repeat-containing protein 48
LNSATTATASRPRTANETPTFPRNTPSKEADYFSTGSKRLSTTSTTVDDFSGWGGPNVKDKEKELTVPQTPSTPSGGGGFMGRLRQFGKSSKRPASGDMMNAAEGSAQLDSGNDGSKKASITFFLSICVYIVTHCQ